MDPIKTISMNIKTLREKRKLSIEALAKVSGVSKSMLAQIERGDVNPTIGVIWKIASGLKLSFTELLEKPEKAFEIVDTLKMAPLVADEGKYRNYPLFMFEADRRFEVYTIEMEIGARNEAEAHPAGTEEYVVVYSGKLAVSAGSEDFIVNTACAAKFKADMRHTYANIGSERCSFCMVIYYPNY